jgi:hypothetical protein
MARILDDNGEELALATLRSGEDAVLTIDQIIRGKARLFRHYFSRGRRTVHVEEGVFFLTGTLGNPMAGDRAALVHQARSARDITPRGSAPSNNSGEDYSMIAMRRRPQLGPLVNPSSTRRADRMRVWRPRRYWIAAGASCRSVARAHMLRELVAAKAPVTRERRVVRPDGEIEPAAAAEREWTTIFDTVALLTALATAVLLIAAFAGGN